ncbi:hypothetical protein DBR06_SOUSAS26310009, partial [Sousa chinensis]
MGNAQRIPQDSPLACIHNNWKQFKLDTWSQYALGDQEKWPQNGFLNFNSILQLDLFCKQSQNWGEDPYVQAYMKFYQDSSLR